MTIEQTLRNDHETLRGLLRRLARVELNSTPSREILVARLRAEWLAHSEAREAIAYGGVPLETATSLTNTEDRKRIEAILKDDAANTDFVRELTPLFEKQFELEQARLLPALRSSYSAVEREELGEIFSEVKSEIRESLVPPVRSTSWLRPKRLGRRLLRALKIARA